MVLTEDALKSIAASMKPRLLGGSKRLRKGTKRGGVKPAESIHNLERMYMKQLMKLDPEMRQLVGAGFFSKLAEGFKEAGKGFAYPLRAIGKLTKALPLPPPLKVIGTVGNLLENVDDPQWAKAIGVGLKKKGGAKPAEAKFYTAAEKSYDPQAPANIGQFDRVLDTPTMDAYRYGNTILVGVRGTDFKDKGDLKADAAIGINNLKNSNRYVKDKKDFQALVSRFPSPQFEYYLAGHSLSGAINQQLKRDFPFIKEGVSYNPAFQPSDLAQQDPSFKRYYTNTDFLYNLGGKFFRNVNMVAPDKPKGIKGWLTPKGVSGHYITNFQKLYQGNPMLGGGPVQSAARGAMNLMDRAATRMDIVALRNFGDRVINEAASREVNEVNYHYVRQLVEEFNQLVMGRLVIAHEDGQDGDFEDIIAINNEIAEIGNPYFVRFGFTIDLLAEIPPEQQEEDEPEGVGAVVVGAPPPLTVSSPLPPPPGSDPDHVFVTQPDGRVVLGVRDRGDREDRERRDREEDREGRGKKGGGPVFGRPARISPEERAERMDRAMRRQDMEDIVFESMQRLESGRRLLREIREREAEEAEEARREEQRERERRAANRTALALARRGYPEDYYRRRGMTGRGKEEDIDFDNIKWGTFTAAMKRFNKKHPSSSVSDLKDFASLVLNNPEDFTDKLRKKAQFYKNVILKGKGKKAEADRLKDITAKVLAAVKK